MRQVCLWSLRWITLLLSVVMISRVSAQSETLLVLDAPTTLQTGQFYEVTIGIEGVASLWLADVEIAYDPTRLYIAGTQSGQPVQIGGFFTSSDLTTIIRNSVNEDRLVYTVSLLNPAEPASGSGTLGTLRIYPLQAGPTQLTFMQAQLATLSFTTDQAGQRIPGSPQSVAFLPVLLDLQVEGSTVSAPSEATATPLPTFTPVTDGPSVIVASPTPLINVTRAPGSGSLTVSSDSTNDTPSQSAVPLVIGAVLVVVSGGLLIVLFRRR